VDVYWYDFRYFENSAGPNLEQSARPSDASPLHLKPLDQAGGLQAISGPEDLHLRPPAERAADRLRHPLGADRRAGIGAPGVDQKGQQRQRCRIAAEGVEAGGEGRLRHQGLTQLISTSVTPPSAPGVHLAQDIVVDETVDRGFGVVRFPAWNRGRDPCRRQLYVVDVEPALGQPAPQREAPHLPTQPLQDTADMAVLARWRPIDARQSSLPDPVGKFAHLVVLKGRATQGAVEGGRLIGQGGQTLLAVAVVSTDFVGVATGRLEQGGVPGPLRNGGAA
jgi:hypothetical protein